MADSAVDMAALRSRLAAIERSQRPAPRGCAGTGHGAIDQALRGGFARGGLHELFAEQEDAGAAAGFAAMLSIRIAGPVFWLRDARPEAVLWGPGLAELGLDPARVTLAVLPDPSALLAAAADVLRHPGGGATVIELWRNAQAIDLTVSRRLALAAEASGMTPILLRIAADPVPSAARTRWAVRSAPSTALAAGAPGHPALDIELLRQRGGPAGRRWRVEWDRERSCLYEPAASGAVVSVPGRGPAADREPLRRAG